MCPILFTLYPGKKIQNANLAVLPVGRMACYQVRREGGLEMVPINLMASEDRVPTEDRCLYIYKMSWWWL